jgi:tetratricopeptide (TPR) repeat protein
MNQAFCTQCGAKLLPQARFCIECGTSVSGARRPSGRWHFPLGGHGPALVLGCVAVVGALAIWLGMLAANPPPRVPGQKSGASAGALPEGHPPIEVTAQMRKDIEALEEKTKTSPKDIAAWLQLGRAQYEAAQIEPDRFPLAAKAYDEVLSRDPKNLDALRMRGNIAYDVRQPREAITFYQRYLALSPGDLSVETDMGTMFLAAGDAPKAIEVYRQVLANDPKFLQAQLNLAVAYRAAGRDDEARTAFEKARDLAPDEETRKQIERFLAPAKPAASPQPDGQKSGGFQEEADSVFRLHPMLGPKVEKIEWPDDRTVRVTVRDFPMNTMPPEARQAFDARIKEGLKAKKEANEVTAELHVELVDSKTGEVLEELVQ